MNDNTEILYSTYTRKINAKNDDNNNNNKSQQIFLNAYMARMIWNILCESCNQLSDVVCCYGFQTYSHCYDLKKGGLYASFGFNPTFRKSS
jgi:hypothetical protein